MGIMQLSNKATMFRSEEGQVFVYADTSPLTDGILFFSPDGKKFFELKRRSFGGNNIKHDLTFEDPHHSKTGRLQRDGDTLKVDGVIFMKIDCRSKIEVAPLPIIRKPEYLFRLKDGRFVYVSADKYRYSEESFKLFIGDGKVMHQVKITKPVSRHQDGGTTTIETEAGVLFSPPKSSRNRVATWNGEEMIRLNPSQFRITETKKGVQISK
jgi:hypothetical protein